MTALNYINRYKYYIFLAISLMLLVIGIFCGTQFQTNDDPGMIFAFSGKFIFDEPISTTAFTTKIWGLLNVYLYKLNPNGGVEFHTYLLLLVNFFSTIFLCTSVLCQRDFNNLVTFVLYILFLVIVILPFYHLLQFTMVAFYAVSVGCFVLLTKNRPKLYEWIFGFALIGIGIIVRPSIFFFVFPVVITMYLCYGILKREIKLGRIFGTAAGVLVLFTTISLIDDAIMTKEEKNYIAFNEFRGSLFDFRFNEANDDSRRSEVIRNMGTTGLTLFDHGFMSDPLLYSEKMDYRSLNTKPRVSQLLQASRLSKNYRGILDQMKSNLRNVFFVLSGVLMIFIVVLINDKRLYLLSALLIGVFIVSTVAISLLFKPAPFRVVYPILACLVLFVLDYGATILNTAILRTTQRILSYSALVIGFIYTVVYYYPLRKWKYVEVHYKQQPSKFYLAYHSAIRFNDFDPFNMSTMAKPFRVMCTGGFSIQRNAHRDFGTRRILNITGELKKNAKDIVILADSSQASLDFISDIAAFMSDKYSVKLRYSSTRNGDFIEYQPEVR